MSDLSLLTIVLTLFLIMDPIGNISSFLTLMKGVDAKRVKFVIFREMLIALAAMLLFAFLGKYLFSFLELSQVSIRLVAGVILFLVSIKILFPSPSNLRANLPEGEPFITPLAIPLIAGPSLLATIMLYSNMESCQTIMWEGILIAWMIACIIFFLALFLFRILGKNGLVACERLMAMVLVMIAIQRFMEGLQLFLKAS